MIAGNALFDAEANQTTVENAGAEKLLTYLQSKCSNQYLQQF
jgi:hypothetical protein